MLKYNDDSIFVGYLKQFLSSFNLPKYRVYTKEQQKYHDWYLATKKEREERIKQLSIEIELWNDMIANPPSHETVEHLTKQRDAAKAELKELKSITPEKNVLITIFRNTAEDYDANANFVALAHKQKETLEASIANIEADIEA